MIGRKVLYGIIVILITVSLLAVLLSIPQKPTAGCKSNDGQCPTPCTYEQDTDCPRSTITTSGEIRRCLSDMDCVVAKPICGNERCDFNAKECQSGCSCGVAVNTHYKTVFEEASVNCLPSGLACAKCTETSKGVCMNGECRLITL